MEIVEDDLSGENIALFLEAHMEDMKSVSPPESKHALDLEDLRKVEITFWSVYNENKLVGCGALKELDALHGEIKSMRTSACSRGRGIASELLRHILETAKSRGYNKVSLETGSMAFFEPARNMYLKHGFQFCTPFGDYKEDPYSVFMSRQL
mgnify:CR=1 FL=1